MKYKLYQIKDVENCSYVFSGFNFAQKDNKFSLNDYEVVYSGEIDDYNIEYTLEKLFDIFNIYHPEDFKGRSMSVSDVVELDGDYYYCDHIGFKKITDLCS
jgi:hypothetical protein